MGKMRILAIILIIILLLPNLVEAGKYRAKGCCVSVSDDWITTTELYNFVKEKVADATNNVQIPVLRPEKGIRLGRIK